MRSCIGVLHDNLQTPHFLTHVYRSFRGRGSKRSLSVPEGRGSRKEGREEGKGRGRDTTTQVVPISDFVDGDRRSWSRGPPPPPSSFPTVWFGRGVEGRSSRLPCPVSPVPTLPDSSVRWSSQTLLRRRTAGR